jgi:quercetin dioxygenase-like cupin family protein
MITRGILTGFLAMLALTHSADAQIKEQGLVAARSSSMQITHPGSQPSRKGPAEFFTGSVRIDSPFQSIAPARVGGAVVTFEPGARTAWHTHPLGQTLIVTSGRGWVQCDGGLVEEIRPGDIVWIPPAVKHWHGATSTTAMTHIAIAESFDGKTVDWMEPVSDEEYLPDGDPQRQ